ncbi:FG-GAP repeat domain-containing protein [Promethearchaeum syntrophicum]|uniref:FG-GAP repeat domain-containing protein n=1 Tax=Promethearchaeum syntrophicum TaxID=2594042 RepID=A0A5B9DCP9_9ARCH|nr:VCBS repeat-containing protein [Candidatus Prometheoarchaeum syntrophicum]QEE17079.1 FG-GAP repeat protein [Candidatus Prometheoarchaeum syntrophicum]
MKKKASMIMTLTIFILLALSFNQNNLDPSGVSQITTLENENQSNDFSNQNYIPRNSANYDPGAKYEWWSSKWTCRIPLAVNSTNINRTDFSMKIDVNFTEYLNNPKLNGGELDVNSIRVVEYEEPSSGFAAMFITNDSYSDIRKYLVPSRFIPMKDDFDGVNNATGTIWLEMPGFSESNANRTFMVYFDSIENGPKDIDEMNVLWNTKYNRNSDVVGDNQFHLAYGSVYRGLGLGGELTIWDSDLQSTMGIPSTKWGNVENYFVMAPGDFDGDGDVELVVSNINNYFSTIDYNQESGLWEEIWDVSYNFDSLHNDSRVRHYNLQSYDMDNDGKDEIIAPSYYNNLYPDALKIVIYGFDENHKLYIKNNLTTPEAYCNDVALADLNQDGFIDIIGGAINGPNDLWRNKSYYYLYDASKPSGYSRHLINYTYPVAADRHIPRSCYSTKAKDIDNDGKIEVLFAETDGRIYIWEWNGTDLEFKSNINTLVPGGLLGAIEDWDLDGRDEVVVGNYDGSIPTSMRVFEVTGDNLINVSINEWANENLPYLRMTFPIFGDMDNSGDIEFAVGCYESSGDYDGRVTVWDESEEFTPEWQSPIEGRMVGAYYYYSESMLTVLGGFDTRLDPLSINYEIYIPDIKPPDLSIQVFDVDKGPVPGLGVILDNGTGTPSYSEGLYTDSNGKVQFTDLAFEIYNLNISIENQMGNRSVYSDIIEINNTRESFVVNSTLWKISFIVEDNNENRLNYGGIDLYNETQGDNVNSSQSLAIDGTCSFYWFEKSSGPNEYNYSIDYLNTVYSPDTTRIYENSVTQQGLTSVENFFNGTTQQTDLGSNNYRHIVSYYARNSSDNNPGDQIINWANIDISDSTGNIYQVEIYGVDQSNNQYLMNTFVEDYGDNFKLEYQLWNNSDPLVGLKLHIFVNNATQDDGIINVTIQETFVERVRVDLFQRKIILLDDKDIPLQNAIVHIYNNNTESLVNLTTNQDGEATDENGEYFWYKEKDGGVIQGNYSMEIEFFNDFRYFIESTESGQLYNTTNFTLTSFEEITYKVNLDSSKYSTNIEIMNSEYLDPLNFKDTLNITVNITAQEVGFSPFSIDPDILWLSLKNSNQDVVYLNTAFSKKGTGIYECLINPMDDYISVSEDDNIFSFIISAETPGYGNAPDPIIGTINILPIDTTLALYNGSTQIVDTLDVYLGIEFDIILLYEDLGLDLAGATAIIDWEYADNELMVEQSGGGFTNYTFLINTTENVRLGTYIIEFTASLTNYSTSTAIIQLNVLEIPTTIKSTGTSLTSELLLINKNISETDIYLFNFSYFDIYHGDFIADAECYYSWNKIETGDFGSNIPMITSGDGFTYILDFDTGNLTEGNYNLIVTLIKSNYQQRQALIYLTVEKRIISYEMVGDFAGSNSIVKVSGQELEFSVNLNDQATGNILLNAQVSLSFEDGKDTIFLYDEDGDGIYTATKTYSKSEINAFFRDNNFQGTLLISADHYATVERDISITIKMDEIIDGIPTFYMLIVIGAVLILVGSLVGYRLVQVSKIPAFVKLINKLEKQISGNKEVLPDKMTLTMEEERIQRFKDEWAILDYDIKEIWKKSENAEDFKTSADNTGGI